MSKAVVVRLSDWSIQDVIVASAADVAPAGTFLIQVPDDLPVDTTYTFVWGVGFVAPVAPPSAEG